MSPPISHWVVNTAQRALALFDWLFDPPTEAEVHKPTPQPLPAGYLLTAAESMALAQFTLWGAHLNARWNEHLDGYAFTMGCQPDLVDFFRGEDVPVEAWSAAESAMALAKAKGL